MHESLLFLPQAKEIKHPEISRILDFGIPEETAAAAATSLLNLVRITPGANITYATGETMKPIYTYAAKERGLVRFEGTSVLHLDERYPCNPTHPSSFAGFIQDRVVTPFGIPGNHVYLWNGLAPDPEAEARRYNALLTEHPIDLAILGIGTDSHIAFDAPGTLFEEECHYVPKLPGEILHRDKIERGEHVPDGALTQGIANILRAKNILLIAYGTQKGEALRHALYDPISTDCPASALRTVGYKVQIYVDAMAAAQIHAPLL